MIKENWKALLQQIIYLIQEYLGRSNLNDKHINEKYRKIICDLYLKITAGGEKQAFLIFLFNEFNSDPKVYTLLLSVVYKCTKDELVLRKIYNFLSRKSLDIFTSMGIRNQLEYEIYTNPDIVPDYAMKRLLHSVQLKQMEEILSVNYPYIPLNERNHNRVLVMSNQLLTDMHAPTRNVKEICSSLVKMGFEVYLVIAVEYVDPNNLLQSWYIPLFNNYNPEYTGDFLIEETERIKGKQIIINEDNIQSMRDMITEIYSFNPLFVWYAGGTSVYTDCLSSFTSVASMPFSVGYAISEARIMVEHSGGATEEFGKMNDYIMKEHQIPLHLDYYQRIKPSSNQYKRQDFDLPEDGFIITIVGTRLNYEINNAFITLLYKIMDIDSRIHVAIIGPLNKLPESSYSNRISYLGLQKDLLGVLNLMDLFLNPPRKGGGTGALWSLYNGVPVITFDQCDVASYVDESFICTDEDDIIKTMEKYLKDNKYYQQKSIRAKQLAAEYENRNNITDSIVKLIDDIKSAITGCE